MKSILNKITFVSIFFLFKLSAFAQCPAPTATISGSQSINQGQSAVLSVALTGAPPWAVVVNGQTYSNILSSPHSITVSPAAAATTYTLSQVSNKCGTGTVSGSATVSVCIPATAVLSGTQTINQGQSATLSVALSGTAPWSFSVNGQVYSNVTASPKLITVNPTTTTTYTITNVSNACGVGTGSGSATVNVCIPATATLCGTQTIPAGSSANLSVALSGTTPWSIIVNGQTYSNITTSPKVISVSPSVSTSYTLSSVSNACGTGTSTGTATVSVCTQASATLSGSQTILRGQNANLSVDLAGSPPWAVTINGQTYSNLSTSPSIIAVNPNTTTTYTLQSVSNACGSGAVSGTAKVTVHAPGCDPMEDNDAYQKAVLVEGNPFSSLNLCFNSNSDQDWYKWRINDKTYFILIHSYNFNSTGNYRFTLNYSSGIVTVTTHSVNGQYCDTYLKLYDSDGETLITENDDFNGSQFSQIVYTIPDRCHRDQNYKHSPIQKASAYRSSTYITSKAELGKGETVYNAGNYIVLEPGFETQANSTFTAKLEGCNLVNPPTNGLVAYYPFNGSMNDASGNGNHGTAMSWQPEVRPRKHNTDSYYFNNNYLKVPNSNSLQFTSGMSISMWYNMDNHPSFNTILSKKGNIYGLKITMSLFDEIQRISMSGMGQDATVIPQGTALSNTNVWKHLGITISNQQLNVYIDGYLINSRTWDGVDFSSTNLSDLIIGGEEYFFEGDPQPYNFWGFNGSIDDIRIYNRALTSNEMISIYNYEY